MSNNKLTFSVVWIQADGSAAARKRLAAGSPQPEAVQPLQRRKRHKSLSAYCSLLAFVYNLNKYNV